LNSIMTLLTEALEKDISSLKETEEETYLIGNTLNTVSVYDESEEM